MTNKLTSTITYGNNVPYSTLDDWQKRSNPWTVTLRYQRRQFTFPFWTGSACGEPTTFDAAYCILSDASGIEGCSSFEDWCWHYGADPDSRKQERLYRACLDVARNVKRLLGDDFDEIAYLDEEDLQSRCR